MYLGPGSVRPADRPPRLQTSRPYIDLSRFTSLDTAAMSFERLLDFIQYNGDISLHCPKKPKRIRKERERWRRLDWTGNSRPNPIAPSSSSDLPPRPVIVQGMANMLAPPPPEVEPAHTKLSPVARSVWDDDVEIVPTSPYAAPVTKPQMPTLSFACRPGWDLNKKTTWIPSAETEHNPCFIP